MMGRTEPAYLEVLNYLKTLAPNFEPRRIHCDFERAMMNAFRRVFPHSQVVGCVWHFAVVSITKVCAPILFISPNYITLIFYRFCCISKGILQTLQRSRVDATGQRR